jgi:hypothetical protein
MPASATRASSFSCATDGSGLLLIGMTQRTPACMLALLVVAAPAAAGRAEAATV